MNGQMSAATEAMVQKSLRPCRTPRKIAPFWSNPSLESNKLPSSFSVQASNKFSNFSTPLLDQPGFLPTSMRCGESWINLQCNFSENGNSYPL